MLHDPTKKAWSLMAVVIQKVGKKESKTGQTREAEERSIIEGEKHLLN